MNARNVQRGSTLAPSIRHFGVRAGTQVRHIQRVLTPLVVACTLVLTFVLVAFASAVPGQAHAASELAPASAPTRPSQAVAYARVALVRVLSYYVGASATSGPVPIQTACASDGVLVGTVGGTNSFNYVLVPSAAVSPIFPCQGVQAAFAELYGTARSWSLQRVTVLMAAAYTGVGTSHLGNIKYSIDPSTITTDGGSGAPSLLTLQLGVPAGSPTHDLPLLTVPQASDAPATGVTTALDLVGSNGQLLERDSLQPQEISDTLYPLDLSAAPLITGATATATPRAPDQGVTGGTVVPGSTVTGASAAPPLAQQLSLGAPVIDSNGRLIGMVVLDSAGEHVVASVAQLKAAIGSINTRPGPLMTAWQQGIGAYYASPPDYASASAAFTSLTTADPDFAGVLPFAQAAAHHSAAIPPLFGTPVPTATATPVGGFGATSNLLLIILAGGAALVVLIAGGAAVVFARRGRRLAAAPAEEEGLDLLPREMMYGIPSFDSRAEAGSDLPGDDGGAETSGSDTTEAVTQVIPRMRVNTGPMGGASDAASMAAVARVATARMPAMRPASAVSRSVRTLVPRVAGITDPGLRRIHDPNQDAILAITGTRLADGRTQPFALLAVADGMGGHYNGREASMLAINSLVRAIMPGLTSAQPLDDAQVDALVREAIQHAHEELRDQNHAMGADMGTTLTAAVLLDDQAYIFNVGDSRTYVLNPDDGLRQVTTDHSIVATLVAAGVIRPEDIYKHPRRNQIYRSLGGEEETIDIDSFHEALQAGDKLLLCSDGLWEMVRAPQLDSILRSAADPQYAAQLLVREANANGGEDNIGIVIARMVEEVPEPGKATVQVIARPSDEPLAGA